MHAHCFFSSLSKPALNTVENKRARKKINIHQLHARRQIRGFLAELVPAEMRFEAGLAPQQL
eukprot:1378893-Amphidinium_carterae.1